MGVSRSWHTHEHMYCQKFGRDGMLHMLNQIVVSECIRQRKNDNQWSCHVLTDKVMIM